MKDQAPDQSPIQNDGPATETASEQDVQASAEELVGGLGGAEAEVEGEPENQELDAEAEAAADASGEDGEAEPGEGESDEALAAPDSPDGYELNVPEDLEWPGGMEITIDMESEEAAQLRQIAFDEGLTQDGMNRLVDAHMRSMAQGYKAIASLLKTNTEAEIAKIGADKIAQIDNQLRAAIGEEAANKLFPVLSTAASYEAVSVLMDKLNESDSPRRIGGGAEPDVSEQLQGRDLLESAFNEGSS